MDFENSQKYSFHDELMCKRIFNKYFRDLTFYANSIIQDIEMAKDIVQNVFTKCFEKSSELIFENENALKTYLFRSVNNFCFNHLERQKMIRKHHKLLVLEQEVSEEKIEEDIVMVELKKRIYNEINNLPPKCKRIFKMSRFENHKNREIAEELNISIRTVEAQISRAMKLLKNRLGDSVTI